jgi:hypothetical protein
MTTNFLVAMTIVMIVLIVSSLLKEPDQYNEVTIRGVQLHIGLTMMMWMSLYHMLELISNG